MEEYGMINFVNKGTDEAILKSLPTENCDDDLVKAMNKQGMVQKEVQVRGKNGTFTRKQWVRASEAGGGSGNGGGKKPPKPPREPKFEDDEFEEYTAADQKAAYHKAQEIATEFGNGKLKKLGNFGYAFKADYKTVKKVVEKYGLDEYYDEHSDDPDEDAGFDYGTQIELDSREGSIFCNQGGFQEDDNIWIGVSFNDL